MDEQEQIVEEEVTAKQETADQNAQEQEAQEEVPAENKKRKGKDRTPQEKKRSRIVGWSLGGGVLGFIALLIALFAILNTVTTKALMEQAKDTPKVVYSGARITPDLDENGRPKKDADGYYSFTTDGDLNILQLTDIHIGSGFLSQQKDTWAMNAVATMIRDKQPDLVIITGDISFPVPYASGSFNNLNAAKVFAQEMESLGVYWTFAFGNHDTEAYSYYSRKQICDWYAKQDFEYCLFNANNNIKDKTAAEDFGYGNNIIKVKNTAGVVTQALVFFDSHSYTDGDFLGALWKYDNIHQSQIDWYAQEMSKLRAANAALGKDEPVKNLAFFHIPLREYREAWSELVNANNDLGTKGNMKDSANVRYIYGVNGEITGDAANPLAKSEENTYGVFCGVKNEALEGKLWAAAAANGMQGVFCGHDHVNNFSVYYTKDGFTMRLTYGMSIDYLAYAGIFQKHSQRGCTAITIKSDGAFESTPLNYYVDFKVPAEAGDLSDTAKPE